MKEFSDVTKEEIDEQYKIISKNVKKYRLLKGVTQEQLALSMGFTTATFYTNAENYRQNKHFNLEHIIKISKTLEVDISKFFEDN